MTEKLYKMVNTNLVDDDGLVYYLIKKDGRDVCQVFGKHIAKAIVTELNSLHEENEQLKQFKEDVFAKIDMHLRMLPTARDNEFNEEDGDPSLFTGAIYMLETLKKELEE